MPSSTSLSPDRAVLPARPSLVTVLGPVGPDSVGWVDAHGHAWIEPSSEEIPGAPVLDDQERLAAELLDFKLAGGDALVDCQPGGCGRNGLALAALSRRSGVHLVACTGFHLRKYYPADAWLWRQNAQGAYDYFVRELTQGLEETDGHGATTRAGFLKLACEDSLAHSPQFLMEAAAQASIDTGAAMEVHTERGADVEAIVDFFLKQGVSAERLVICHIDKRPDYSLHRSLAEANILLEYDTFFRPKYNPALTVWPLLVRMLAEGLFDAIALANDIADPSMMARFGGSPGMADAFTRIYQRLQAYGFEENVIRKVMGKNISQRLAMNS